MVSCKEQVTFVVPSRRMDDLLLHCIEKTNELYPGAAFIAVLDEKEDLSTESFSLPDSVTVLYSAKTTISAKRNAGSERAETKYLAFIDSDAYPNKGWVENGVEFLETHPVTFAMIPQNPSYPTQQLSASEVVLMGKVRQVTTDYQ